MLQRLWPISAHGRSARSRTFRSRTHDRRTPMPLSVFPIGPEKANSGHSPGYQAFAILEESGIKQIAHPQLGLESVNRKSLMIGTLPRPTPLYALLASSRHEVERQKRSARLVPHRLPVQSNVRFWVKCEEQVVRQIDVEGSARCATAAASGRRHCLRNRSCNGTAARNSYPD